LICQLNLHDSAQKSTENEKNLKKFENYLEVFENMCYTIVYIVKTD